MNRPSADPPSHLPMTMYLPDKTVVFGDHDDGTLAQIHRAALAAQRALLCADGHRGYGVPIGGVVAYAEAVSPTAAGYDIACGNKAVLTDMPAAEAKRRIRP